MEEKMYREDCSFLIQKCTRYMESHPNAELWLRDTDHKYCPIRLESKGVPREDYNELLSTCPHCGSTFHGKLWGNNEYYEDYGFNFCNYCLAQSEKVGAKKLQRLLSYTSRIDGDNNNEHETSPNIHAIHNRSLAHKTKLRVWTSQQTLLYLSLDRIRLNEDGVLYIDHGKDKNDIVKFAGMYLNIRDRHGCRIYQGDVVKLQLSRYAGDKFESKGLVEDIWLSRKRKRYDLVIVEDPISPSFPLLPDWIDYRTIEVLGNIYETPEIMGSHFAKIVNMGNEQNKLFP